MATRAAVMCLHFHLHLPYSFPIFILCPPATLLTDFLKVPALRNSLNRLRYNLWICFDRVDGLLV